MRPSRAVVPVLVIIATASTAVAVSSAPGTGTAVPVRAGLLAVADTPVIAESTADSACVDAAPVVTRAPVRTHRPAARKHHPARKAHPAPARVRKPTSGAKKPPAQPPRHATRIRRVPGRIAQHPPARRSPPVRRVCRPGAPRVAGPVPTPPFDAYQPGVERTLFLAFGPVPVVGWGTPIERHRRFLGIPVFLAAVGGTLAYIVNGWGVAGLPPYSMGYIDLMQFVLLAGTSVVTAQLGVKMAHRLPAEQLRYIFIILMVYVGLRMIGVFIWLGLPI